jgi:DNA repair protein RadC
MLPARGPQNDLFKEYLIIIKQHNKTTKQHSTMENEILSTLIGKVNAAKLLKLTTFDNVLTMHEKEIEYLTNKKCAAIIAAAKKLSRGNATGRKVAIRQSADIYDIPQIYEMQFLDHEQFRVVFLRRNNTPIAIETIGTGGYAACMVDTRILWKRALELKATGIALVHNHPSGNIAPSPSDDTFTNIIKKQSELMQIKLLDHLIIASALGQTSYYSYTDEGAL